MAITLDRIKSKEFLAITNHDDDTDLQNTLDSVIARAISYLDNSDIDTAAKIPMAMEQSIYKQASYDWRRKKDIGLKSTADPNGNVMKYSDDEWLPEVKKVLNRYRKLFI